MDYCSSHVTTVCKVTFQQHSNTLLTSSRGFVWETVPRDDFGAGVEGGAAETHTAQTPLGELTALRSPKPLAGKGEKEGEGKGRRVGCLVLNLSLATHLLATSHPNGCDPKFCGIRVHRRSEKQQPNVAW